MKNAEVKWGYLGWIWYILWQFVLNAGIFKKGDQKQLPIINNDCMSCGECEELCLNGAILPRESFGKVYSTYYIDQALCINCGVCLETIECPGDAFRES